MNTDTIEMPAKQDEKGFTLVELLIVIVILGILATIVVFSVRGLSNRANTNSCSIDLRSLKTAVEASRADTGNYPANEAALSPNYLEAQSSKYNYTLTAGAPVYTIQDARCGAIDAVVP